AMNVVPNSRRIRPVTSDCPHGGVAFQGALTSRESWILQHSLAAISMTVRAKGLIDMLPLTDRAAPLGQARGIRRDGDVQFANLFRRRRSSNLVLFVLSKRGCRHGCHRTNDIKRSFIHG